MTPLAKSLALRFGDVSLATADSMMRTISACAPAKNLSGASDIEKAQVEGWMSFVWSSLELPLAVMEKTEDKKTKAAFAASLATLERHLQYQTFMVGHSITIADISVAVALYSAVDSKLWEVKEGDNLARFYQTITHQSFFQEAIKSMKSTSTIGSAASAATSGVLLSGAPTPVVNKMYRRHRIRIKEIVKDDGEGYMNQTVTVAGWTRTTRNANKGQLLFIELNDGSTGASLQCVLNADETEGFAECKKSGGTGSSFQLVGKIIASQGQGQAVELQVTTGKLLGAVYGANHEGTEVGGMLYPMSKKAHTLEYMRDVAHLRPRGRIHAAAMRVRHAMAYATHNFFHNHGFLYIHTPIVTCADCEGAGEQFAVTTMLGNEPSETGISIPLYEAPKVRENAHVVFPKFTLTNLHS